MSFIHIEIKDAMDLDGPGLDLSNIPAIVQVGDWDSPFGATPIQSNINSDIKNALGNTKPFAVVDVDEQDEIDQSTMAALKSF